MLQDNLKKQAPIFTKIRPKAKFNNLTFLLFSRSYHSGSVLPHALARVEQRLGKKRLTKLERSKFTLFANFEQVLIGNILDDVYIRRFSDRADTRIVFRQGSTNAGYLLHLYSLFEK